MAEGLAVARAAHLRGQQAACGGERADSSHQAQRDGLPPSPSGVRSAIPLPADEKNDATASGMRGHGAPSAISRMAKVRITIRHRNIFSHLTRSRFRRLYDKSNAISLSAYFMTIGLNRDRPEACSSLRKRPKVMF